MALDLTGRSVFITGAGSGIGKATALRFAAAGSRLFLVGRTESKLVEVQKEILEKHPNVEVVLSAIDLNDKNAVDTAVQSAVDKFGDLSVVIANAGVAASITEKFEVWEEAVATNLTSVMYLSKAVLPHLEKSVLEHSHASLVVVSSVVGFLKNGPYAPYVASKHGVNGFALSLFEAIKDKGIKVTVVNPAMTDTPLVQSLPWFNKKAAIPTESIAHAIHFAATFPDGGCPTEINVFTQYTQEMPK